MNALLAPFAFCPLRLCVKTLFLSSNSSRVAARYVSPAPQAPISFMDLFLGLTPQALFGHVLRTL